MVPANRSLESRGPYHKAVQHPTVAHSIKFFRWLVLSRSVPRAKRCCPRPSPEQAAMADTLRDRYRRYAARKLKAKLPTVRPPLTMKCVVKCLAGLHRDAELLQVSPRLTMQCPTKRW